MATDLTVLLEEGGDNRNSFSLMYEIVRIDKPKLRCSL